jgi:hypothetical protein
MLQIPSIHKFSFGLTPIAASFKTAPTNEGIEYGCIGHFELEVCSKTEYMMMGLIEGTNIIPPDTRLSSGIGCGIYLTNMSLYSASTQDQFEFGFVELRVGDTVGIYFDMREYKNSRAFLTRNGRVVGQMFKNLIAPVYPAVSYSVRITSLASTDNIPITNGCAHPIGWNDKMFHDEHYIVDQKLKFEELKGIKRDVV